MNLRYFILFLAIACQPSANVGSDSGPKQSTVHNVKPQHLPETRMTKDFLHGVWQNVDPKDIDFILHLNIVDDLVLGEYCSKAKTFFLEDCSLEDEGSYCSVRGPFNQYSAEVGLESCINAKIGEAFIRREDENLKLILDKPAGKYAKDHLVPDTTILKKISNEPY